MEMMSLKNHIKYFRIKNGWNQDTLAKKTNISRQTISLIERNKLIPSVIISLKIATLFSENVEDIFIIERED